jgi:hypothetical protein
MRIRSKHSGRIVPTMHSTHALQVVSGSEHGIPSHSFFAEVRTDQELVVVKNAASAMTEHCEPTHSPTIR